MIHEQDDIFADYLPANPTEYDQTRYEQMKAKFEAYHEDHPRVFRLLCRYVSQVKAAGYRNYSISAVIERIRWETNINSDAPNRNQFKINNNHKAFYSRLYMAERPKDKDFFRTRAMISKERPAVDLPELTPADYE